MKPRHAALLVLTLCLVWKAYATVAPDAARRAQRRAYTNRVLAEYGLHRERLRGASLRGLDLRGLDFSEVNLHNADLRRADLSGASFEEPVHPAGVMRLHRDGCSKNVVLTVSSECDVDLPPGETTREGRENVDYTPNPEGGKQ